MFRRFCIAFLTSMAMIVPASAAEWPAEQVTIIAPFPTAGTTDLIARLLAENLERRLRQSVIVVDKPGASGGLGTAFVAKAKPDGYTLLVGTVATHAINPNLEPKLPYDAEKDFIPVAFLARVPNMLVVSPNSPAKTLPELIEHIKANPSAGTYGSAGTGTSQHMAGELFKLKTGVNLTHVSFRSANEIMEAITTGKVQMAFNNTLWAWPLAKSGKARAIAIASPKRSPSAPDVPAIAETIPGFDASSWNGLFVPAGTPRPIVDKLSAEVSEMLKEPFVVKQLSVLGVEVEIMTPEQFAAFCATDRAKWREVVKATSAKTD